MYEQPYRINECASTASTHASAFAKAVRHRDSDFMMPVFLKGFETVINHRTSLELNLRGIYL